MLKFRGGTNMLKFRDCIKLIETSSDGISESYEVGTHGLRFGVERMPEKLVYDLRDLADHATGYDFHDKGFALSFNKQIDKQKLARHLGTHDFMVDYEGNTGGHHIYNVIE